MSSRPEGTAGCENHEVGGSDTTFVSMGAPTYRCSVVRAQMKQVSGYLQVEDHPVIRFSLPNLPPSVLYHFLT